MESEHIVDGDGVDGDGVEDGIEISLSNVESRTIMTPEMKIVVAVMGIPFRYPKLLYLARPIMEMTQHDDSIKLDMQVISTWCTRKMTLRRPKKATPIQSD
jgi:hypothetical protein